MNVTSSRCRTFLPRPRKRRYLQTLFLFCGLTILYLRHSKEYSAQKSSSTFSSRQNVTAAEKSVVEMDKAIREKFSLREKHLKQTCLNSSFPPVRYGSHTFFGARRYNLTQCNVHKVGSSAMMKAFYVLNSKKKTTEAIQNEFRLFVSYQKTSPWGRIPGAMKSSLQEASRSKTIIVTRNPFHRLFSGYMDREYVVSELGKDKTLASCPTQTGFEHFLSRKVEQMKKAPSSVNAHFAPLNWQCRPCLLSNRIFVVEMEDLEAELTFLLKDIGIKKDVLTVALETFDFALFRKSNVDWFQGRFVAFLKMRTKCVSTLEFVQRYWYKYQSQGLIEMSKKFPAHLFNETYPLNPSNVADIIRTEMREKALTKSQSKRQRLDAMRMAYSSIPIEIIEEIQRFYLADFKLFNYDMYL